MGRIIIFDTGYQTVTTAQDLLEIQFATTQAAIVHRAKIMQSSDETAAEAEELQVNLKRASGHTSGANGGTASEVLLTGLSASGVLIKERNNTQQASGGTIEVIEPGVFNVLAGEWEYTPIPELRLPIGPNQAVILSLDEAPADALTLRAILIVEIMVG